MKYFYSAYIVKKTKSGNPRISNPEIYADNSDDQKDIEALMGAISEYVKIKFAGTKPPIKCEFYVEVVGDILKTTKEMKRFDMTLRQLTKEDLEHAEYWQKFNKHGDSETSEE